MVSQKSVFWKALVLTLIFFLLGVGVGFFLEKGRIDELQQQYAIMETAWADSRLANIYYQNLDPQYCDSAIEQNLIFGDEIYQKGLKLDKYDESAPLTETSVELERKRYALFKTEFLLNSISLKEKCSANYNNLVYFFKANPTLEEKSAQKVQSQILKDLKGDLGPSLMLIPLPIDLDIAVIDLLKDFHNISSVPTILINEEIKLEGVKSIDDLKNVLQEIS